MLRINHVKNFANFYTPVKTLEGLEEVIKESNNSVFGIEIDITKRGVATNIIAPPHIRLVDDIIINRKLDVSGLGFYEGFLMEPFFLPIHRGLDGELITDIQELPISLVTGERIVLQWLFRKTANWKDKALEMYSSYLQGNDFPFSFKVGRMVQDKVLQTLNRISSYSMDREYIEEVERKILSEGFQFQMRIGIKSESEDVIVNKLNTLLKKYASYNIIQVYRVKDDKIAQLLQDCVLTADTTLQIISRGELVSLLGGVDDDIELINSVIPQEQPVLEVREERKVTGTNKGDAIQILPHVHRDEIEVPDDIVSEVAEAMKRVGLISSARVYNESVTAGVRLTVVQFSIPKRKTITQIQNRQKDIMAALGVPSLGVEQGEIPDTVKFTIPIQEPAIIGLRELLEDNQFHEYSKENELAFIVGVDEINNPIYLSLSQLVHLLVAGTTGSGKSVFINSLAVSLMTMYSPEYLQMYMVDPKEVELQHYEGFPHVREVVTDMGYATKVLKSLTKEMDERYSMFRGVGVKSIGAYNQKVAEKMPYIVCVVDEYADLKDTNPEVEDHIGRLGQKARAAGIHLVIATQRPSTDIISGRIKAVIPNAISFNLNNNTNYKTVFGTGIPYNQLLGRGDGVMKIEGYPKEFQRFQSAIVTPNEVEEEQVFDELRDYFVTKYRDSPPKDEESLSSSLQKEPEPVPEVDTGDAELAGHIYKLKQIIADTGETRIAPLRQMLGVKTSTMPKLMAYLVEDGWLLKHESRAKGYEVIASDTTLSEWKTN